MLIRAQRSALMSGCPLVVQLCVQPTEPEHRYRSLWSKQNDGGPCVSAADITWRVTSMAAARSEDRRSLSRRNHNSLSNPMDERAGPMVFFACWSGFSLKPPGRCETRPIIPGNPLVRLCPCDIHIVGGYAYDQTVLSRRLNRWSPDAKRRCESIRWWLNMPGHTRWKVGGS